MVDSDVLRIYAKEGLYLARVIGSTGLIHTMPARTLSEAIDIIADCEDAELLEIEEFVEGEYSAKKLAKVFYGGWEILDKEKLDMATVEKVKKNGATGRDVAEDLLGNGKREKKAKKEKGMKKAAKSERPNRSGFEEKQRIVVKNKDFSPREGSNSAKIWGCIKSGRTVGDFMKARSKLKGMPGNGLPYLGSLVRKGIIAVK